VPPIVVLLVVVVVVVVVLVVLVVYGAGGKIETNEMGRACSAYGGGLRCAKGVGGEA